jgi:manganese-dependent ADP-ribose/CDP-alcohol diphosphatase
MPDLCPPKIPRLQTALPQDNGTAEARTQYYRSAPQRLQRAIEHFNAEPDLACVLSLGDAIDGNTTLAQTLEELESVAHEFDQSSKPVWHVLGNHCLAGGRSKLLERLKIPSSYYTQELAPGIRLIALDTTECSNHSGFPEDSWQAKEAQEYMQQHASDCNLQRWNGGEFAFV